ncbi:phosphatidylinositol phosphatase PTPRQ-like [Xenia sp. Carnegie-2017]|uniref:phosphatidylinositol phosphatase PTPRQ-like n=1 Tax=Xenia sp. Carnegie-2017 TaxID=2897299 RepID=UPI001F04094E|nr:phosphatidylinositol phosphatase PTPRQ-like [Xenia sp. Carnegie-2017]
MTSCTPKVTVPFTKTSYAFTGLKPYVQYSIEISAATKVGYGPRAKITQRTRESVPNGPPTKFQISGVDATNITASWLPPDPALRNGRIINYKLCIKIGSTSQGPCLLQITTGNITVYTFSNLKPNTKYQLRISAATKIGYGSAAVLTTRTLEAEPSGAPRNLNVVSYTKNFIKTTWSSPDSSLLNGILTKYSVCLRRQSLKSCTPKVIVPFTKTSYTFTGLKPYVQYTIEISAGTKAGYGPRAKITQRTRESVPNGPPIKFQITRVDITNITSSWLPPDPALRNGRIINYKLCIKIGNTSQGPCLLQATTGNITVYTFSNLKPYTKYHLRISAATKIGYGPAAVLTTRTLEAEPSGAPRNLNVVSYTKNFIKATWSSPDSSLLNGILTKYSVCIRRQSLTSCTTKVTVPFSKHHIHLLV